ncbi:hypothetical protein K449DRAFT_439434 [Hypoxylon sp. EC38]|nr:hypothetical protein K449DRAFT_439434 [Hypoxylon sp. EC38]
MRAPIITHGSRRAEKRWDAKAIVGYRLRSCATGHLVKWAGYPASHNTQDPTVNATSWTRSSIHLRSHPNPDLAAYIDKIYLRWPRPWQHQVLRFPRRLTFLHLTYTPTTLSDIFLGHIEENKMEPYPFRYCYNNTKLHQQQLTLSISFSMVSPFLFNYTGRIEASKSMPVISGVKKLYEGFGQVEAQLNPLQALLRFRSVNFVPQ